MNAFCAQMDNVFRGKSGGQKVQGAKRKKHDGCGEDVGRQG